MQRHFYLIAYDIRQNARRLKVAKLLESAGNRVQDSVFEAHLSEPEREKLEKRAKKMIDMHEDSIRFYLICQNCQKKVRIIGQGNLTQAPEVIIL